MKNKQTPQQIVDKLLNPELEQEDSSKIKKNITKQEVLKKEAAPVKKLSYYDVKVECMIPATLIYKVLAEDAHQALELTRGKTPNQVSHKIIGRKELVVKVFDSGSNIIRFMKKLLG